MRQPCPWGKPLKDGAGRRTTRCRKRIWANHNDIEGFGVGRRSTKDANMRGVQSQGWRI